MQPSIDKENLEDVVIPKWSQSAKKDLLGYEIVFLSCCLIFGFILRQLIEVRLVPDSIDYLTFARNILAGIHNTGDLSFILSFRRPPLYPHLIAFFCGGNNSPMLLVEIARQISILFGTFVIIPIYFLTRKMISRRAAAFAAVTTVLTPELIYYSGAVLAESMCLFLISVSFLILWFSSQNKERWYLHLLLGVCLGLAFLCRHLAIGFLGLSLFWMVAANIESIKGKKTLLNFIKIGASCLLIVLAFMVTIIPQILYLHEQTGKWALAVDPLSTSALKVQFVGTDIRYTAKFEARDTINEDGDRYEWEEKESSGLGTIIKVQPINYIKAFLSTLFKGYLTDTCPLPYPKILIILAAIGIAALFIMRRYKILIFICYLFLGYYVFLALFLTMRDRYMLLAYPLLLITAGIGADSLLQWAGRFQTRSTTHKWFHGGIFAIIFLVIFGSLFFPTMKLIREQNAQGNKNYCFRIGEDLSKRIEKNAYIFDRTPHFSFFAGGTKATPPFADIEEVLRFARKRGVRYWIISTYYVPSLRPQYEPLLDPKKHHEGLRPIVVYTEGENSKTVVYEILQE